MAVVVECVHVCVCLCAFVYVCAGTLIQSKPFNIVITTVTTIIILITTIFFTDTVVVPSQSSLLADREFSLPFTAIEPGHDVQSSESNDLTYETNMSSPAHLWQQIKSFSFQNLPL